MPSGEKAAEITTTAQSLRELPKIFLGKMKNPQKLRGFRKKKQL